VTDVFAEAGDQRGKTATVAQRIGVSEPVIFQNFDTKAAPLAALVQPGRRLGLLRWKRGQVMM
jgi:hypothetical protein